MKIYLGIDVGSVSTNLVALSEENEILSTLYLRTGGEPLKAVQRGLKQMTEELPATVRVCGVGTTGSGRQLTSAFVGGDVVKNEITAHAVAALNLVPDVRTVLEIGGQDSKVIILRDGIVTDFAMNTVCAAGTGSFLDRQAARLDVPIEEFGRLALESTHPARIAGRCAVFAESDMIHKQQVGVATPDIVRGLCEALVRNYLNNVAKGKELLPPVIFQGGVSCNVGIVRAFEEALDTQVIVPEHNKVMGAIGSALLAREHVTRTRAPSRFRGFAVSDVAYRTTSFVCDHCANSCEIVEIFMDEKLTARWGGRCDRWDRVEVEREPRAG